jgi:pimeloyl-ACP methyl ester carboxylesterase
MQTKIRDQIRLPREGTFSLGDVMLESGGVLRQAFVGYKVHGQLNADRTNGIVYPTQFAAQHSDIEWLIGPGRALDSDRYFIIAIDQLGNGVSSSPSNTPAPHDRSRFPAVTIRDDVAAQYRLVTEGFGLQKLALVTGYSMGAQQAFQWAVSYPALVERIAPFCGTAKTTAHNRDVVRGVRRLSVQRGDRLGAESPHGLGLEGGYYPVWSRAGGELLYLTAEGRVMAVSYSTKGDSFVALKPRAWSEVPILYLSLNPSYDLAPDGKRLAAMMAQNFNTGKPMTHLTFLLNFFDEVRRRAPAGGK